MLVADAVFTGSVVDTLVTPFVVILWIVIALLLCAVQVALSVSCDCLNEVCERMGGDEEGG